MDRADFEAFLRRTLWRDGDTEFAADLPLIIRMGESRLSRDLMVQPRLSATVLHVIDNFGAYPPDYHSPRLLSDECGPLRYVTPDQWATRRAARDPRSYTLNAEGFMFTNSGHTPENPGFYALSYYTKLPEYVDAETWVQTNYFDLYTHACLINSAPYLQADERLPIWQSFYAEELESARLDDAHRQFNGSPLKVKLPGVVA